MNNFQTLQVLQLAYLTLWLVHAIPPQKRIDGNRSSCFKNGESWRRKEASWEIRNTHSFQTLELVNEIKKPWEQEDLGLERESAPGVVSECQAKPWFIKCHHRAKFLRSGNKSGDESDFELSKTRDERMLLVWRQEGGWVREAVTWFLIHLQIWNSESNYNLLRMKRSDIFKAPLPRHQPHEKELAHFIAQANQKTE